MGPIESVGGVIVSESPEYQISCIYIIRKYKENDLPLCTEEVKSVFQKSQVLPEVTFVGLI